MNLFLFYIATPRFKVHAIPFMGNFYLLLADSMHNNDLHICKMSRMSFFNIFTIFVDSFWGGLTRNTPVMSAGSASLKHFFFLSFSLSAIFWLIILSPFLIFIDQFDAACSAMLIASIMSVNIYLWRRGIPIVYSHFVFQASLIFLIIFNAYHMGGVASPAMVWLGIVPILPFFVASRGWSYFWIFISFSTVIAMYLLDRYLFLPHASVASTELWATMIGLLAVTQAMLVITYDKATAKHFFGIQQKNERLKNLSDRLQVLNKDKDKFLATVSHELRTPLNAIVGYLDLLRSNPNLPTESREHAQHAHHSSALLLTVINDLLDFTQIKQGQFAFNPQVVNTQKVLTTPHDLLRTKALAQGIDFSIQLSDGLPAFVHADPDRLCQIILNLLNNAIKFTPNGSVYFSADFRATQPNEGHLYLKITDTGVGIPAQSQQIIFEPFVQLDNHRDIDSDDSLRGNGLGLSIIQNLIQAWGGSIQLTSEVGVGSTFEIWLPLKVAASPISTTANTPNETVYPDSRRILIVDDHALNRMVASATILHQMPNAFIDEAKNGAEALLKMSSNTYDVVLMDLVMPDMSGIDVVRKVRRECPAPFCHVRVAAFTANLAEDAIQECRSVGMQDILSKPLNKESLFQVLLQPA